MRFAFFSSKCSGLRGLREELFERVVGGLHPGLHLLLHAAGEKADVAAGGHDHAGDEHLLVVAALHLLERRADAEERLAGAGLAIDGDERDRGIVERVEEEALAEIRGLESAPAADGDVVVPQLTKLAVAEVPRGDAVRGLLFVAQQHVLVGQKHFELAAGRCAPGWQRPGACGRG